MEKDFKYMVATRCFTYNHAPYILDALNGFSSQKASFPVVYIVVDDASKDGEQEVIQAWAENNLDFNKSSFRWIDMPYGKLAEAPLKGNLMSNFAIILLAENHYQKGNGAKRLVYIAEWEDNAKYRAVCEGDDYWTDSSKLQKQVAFLESHPDYSMCFHNAKTVNVETGESFDKFQLPNNSCKYTPSTLFSKGWFAPTASLLFKNLKIPEELSKYKKEHCPKTGGDIVLQLYLASVGPFWFMSDTMSVYRFGVPGSATMASKNDGGKSYKQYLKLLSYANRTMFESRYFVFVLYRRCRFFLRQILFRS